MEPGYLKVSLSRGDVVSSGMLTQHREQPPGILVDIPTSNAMFHVGEAVHILVVSASGRLWSSSPVTVVSAAHSGGLVGSGGSPLIVEMSWTEAVTFEKQRIHGTVSVVGIRP